MYPTPKTVVRYDIQQVQQAIEAMLVEGGLNPVKYVWNDSLDTDDLVIVEVEVEDRRPQAR